MRGGPVPASRTDESLAAELYPSLRQLAAVIAPAEVGPDDLLQDALVAALRQGPLASLDDPAAYLARTMLNLAANHRRRFGRAHRVLVRWRGGRTAQTLDEYPSDLDDLATLQPGSTCRAVPASRGGMAIRSRGGASRDVSGDGPADRHARPPPTPHPAGGRLK